MSDFKKLKVWRKAHALSLNVHRTARGIHGAEYTSLRSQLVRAAMSTPANIVEGSGQQSRREFARFLRIALNSAIEVEYHLIVGRDMGILKPADVASLVAQNAEVRKMLFGLLKRVLSTSETAPRQVSAASPEAAAPLHL
jgi:four helix bundle protein